jgi:hypothetical protein
MLDTHTVAIPCRVGATGCPGNVDGIGGKGFDEEFMKLLGGALGAGDLNCFRAHIFVAVALVLRGAIGQSVEGNLRIWREICFDRGGHEGVGMGDDAIVAHVVRM